MEADEYFVSDQPLNSTWMYVHRAHMTRSPEGNGDAGFSLVRESRELTTRYYWKAHPANASEIAPGRKVVIFEGPQSAENVYSPPATKDDAMTGSWFFATVADVSDQQQGFVRVSGGYKVRLDDLRIVEGENNAVAASSAGNEDRHWFTADDFFVSESEPSNASFTYVKLAKQLKAPTAATKNLGEYFVPNDGRTLYSGYAWKSYLASESDLTQGTPVVCFERGPGADDAYLAPETKDAARTGTWFMGKVTDRSDLFRGIVGISGGYKCRIDGVRVLAK